MWLFHSIYYSSLYTTRQKFKTENKKIQTKRVMTQSRFSPQKNNIVVFHKINNNKPYDTTLERGIENVDVCRIEFFLF